MITAHQQVTVYLTTFGFALTMFYNSILIYITAYHIKTITGLYKKMIIAFAFLGILFDLWELIAQPFLYNLGSSFMYFSMSESVFVTLQFLQVALAIYGAFLAMIMSFIALQFYFRYLVIKNSPWIKKKSRWLGSVFAVYVLFFGILYGCALYFMCQPDKYTDEYMRMNIRRTYNMEPRNFPRLIVNIYGPDGEFRWLNILGLCSVLATILVQYIVIIYCGITMHINLRKKLDSQSFYHRTLEQQFFHALLVQITLPSILLMQTALPVVILPFLNLNIGFQSGLIYIPFSFYTPMDSMAFMWIMSEYATRIREVCGLVSGQSIDPEFHFPANYLETNL